MGEINKQSQKRSKDNIQKKRIAWVLDFYCLRDCCCCCEVASVMSDSVWPHRRQPTRLPCPWDFPGKNTGVGCHYFSNAWKWKVKMRSLSHVWLFVTPWTAAYQGPLSMGFSRQDYCTWITQDVSAYAFLPYISLNSVICNPKNLDLS